MTSRDALEKSHPIIGIFDSGVGGFSVLVELFKIFPEAEYYYYSDAAHAPYGPKSDEFITERAFVITKELLNKGADLIAVACNTATASSIDALRLNFPQIPFVGVEPYLNAYYKESTPSKMAVLTTESTGKSERFKRLKERLDPKGLIDSYSLRYLARNVEDLYSGKMSVQEFDTQLESELLMLKNKQYTHVILGCTHYPLVKNKIESILSMKALSPCPYVASRVKEMVGLKTINHSNQKAYNSENFYFYSSEKPEWILKSRADFLGPFNSIRKS